MSNVSLQKEKKVGIVASCKDTHVFATEFNESLYNVYASLCHYGEPKKSPFNHKTWDKRSESLKRQHESKRFARDKKKRENY